MYSCNGIVYALVTNCIRVFGENEFVSEYDAGKFAGVVYGINQRSDTLAESFAGDGAGNAGNDAGSTWYRRCMRCEVGSSTKLAPSRRVSTKIGSASMPTTIVVAMYCHLLSICIVMYSQFIYGTGSAYFGSSSARDLGRHSGVLLRLVCKLYVNGLEVVVC